MMTIKDKDGNVTHMSGVFQHRKRWITNDVKAGIRRGDKATLKWLRDMIGEMAAAENEDTRKAMYTIAQTCTAQIVSDAQHQTIPEWLSASLETDHRVPWQMINGKPASGFDDLDQVAGHKFLKRGKQQFLAPQTRDVANVIQGVLQLRRMCLQAPHWCEGDSKSDQELKTIAELPDLSSETIDQWWEVIKPMIKSHTTLTDAEIRGLRASANHDTDNAALNEYMKRCRKALVSLCPE